MNCIWLKANEDIPDIASLGDASLRKGDKFLATEAVAKRLMVQYGPRLEMCGSEGRETLSKGHYQMDKTKPRKQAKTADDSAKKPATMNPFSKKKTLYNKSMQGSGLEREK